MTERCERCKKGYAAAPPKDDIEWPGGAPEPWRAGLRELRTGRCTRCSSWLVDLWSTDPERQGAETHDICVVLHDEARAAILERRAAPLAAISSQLRRKHSELLVASITQSERSALEQIEQGAISATEVFRGLVTRLLATRADLPLIGDVRPHSRPNRSATGAGVRAPLDLGDGSRLILDAERGGMMLKRMRGDAVAWRTEIPEARAAFVARVAGRATAEFVVLSAPTADAALASAWLLDAADGALRGPSQLDVRVALFEAHALPSGCTFVASYQSAAVIRADASVVWRGSATGVPVAVAAQEGAVVPDAPWRLVYLELPSGTERWAIPMDRGGTIAAAGADHVLLTTSDAVARIAIEGTAPHLVWIAAGSAPLALSDGGAAIVRERWERGARQIECLVIAPDGKKRYTVPRPDATKAPVAEIGRGVLLFHSGSDAALVVGDRVVYALSLPDRRVLHVTVEQAGVWIEHDGIVDRVDESGRRTGRWRVG